MVELDYTFENRLKMQYRDAKEEGKISAYLDMINEGLISVETASSKLGISPEEFNKRIQLMNESTNES